MADSLALIFDERDFLEKFRQRDPATIQAVASLPTPTRRKS